MKDVKTLEQLAQFALKHLDDDIESPFRLIEETGLPEKQKHSLSLEVNGEIAYKDGRTWVSGRALLACIRTVQRRFKEPVTLTDAEWRMKLLDTIKHDPAIQRVVRRRNALFPGDPDETDSIIIETPEPNRVARNLGLLPETTSVFAREAPIRIRGQVGGQHVIITDDVDALLDDNVVETLR